MRRGALISFLIHVAILMAILIVLPPETLPPAMVDSVDVDLVGPNAPQQGLKPSKVAAPMDTQTVNKAPLAVQQPKPQTIAPPPPPPPPPPESKATPAKPTPSLPNPPPPPPVVTPTQTPVPPPPPRHPRTTESHSTQTKAPPQSAKNAAPPKSVSHNEHVVKAPPVLTTAQLQQLLKFESSAPQTQPPKAVYNPDQGGAPKGGGTPQTTSNSGLTGADRDAIGAHVKPCFNVDDGAVGLSTFSVELLVQTGPDGTVHEAQVAPQDLSKLGDPVFNAYAQRAIDAVMNYQCATLPLPPNMLGHNQTLLFNFTPGD